MRIVQPKPNPFRVKTNQSRTNLHREQTKIDQKRENKTSYFFIIQNKNHNGTNTTITNNNNNNNNTHK